MSEDEAFLAGGGEMGERIRTFDWAATPLGSPNTWPTALRSAVSITLGSSFPTAIYWGPELRLLYNDAWAPIPAERHPDALGRPGKEVWPDIWHVVGPQFEEVFRTGKGVSTFDQMLPMVRNGLPEETYWNYSLSAIRNDDGSIAGVFNQGHETSARVLAERRLRQLNESLEEQVAARTGERNELWDLSRDIMLRCGFDGKILTVNPAWTELLGWREDELIGSSLFEFIHPDDLEHTRTAAASHKDGGSYSGFENRYRHRDGSYRWISWSTRPTNEVITAVGRDITAEKEAAEALARTEDALRQSQKMEAVGQLTGGIAHDFNNLLQGVAGSLDLIRRNPGDPARVHRWAEAGLHAAERGAKLTGQLLAFSRAQKIEARPLRVTALIAGMRELLARTLGPEIRIAMDLDEDCPPVLSDATQLEMSVLNLAINSRDAMPSGGRLTIGVRRRKVRRDPELSDGDYVEIAVTDTGIGMPPDVLARAFDPFFTTKGVGRGTGLGLSQVYGIARQVGGTTRIRTGEGTGTTVSIFLPVTDQPIEKASNNERELVRSPRSATVLVVDDDEDVRTFLAESLESLGFTVETAEGGEEALASLERLQPSLMILDFAMPDMNGAQVLRSVRSSHPDLPVILASGFSDTTALEHAGGQHSYVLHKPFRVDDLSMAVDAALRERVNA